MYEGEDEELMERSFSKKCIYIHDRPIMITPGALYLIVWYSPTQCDHLAFPSFHSFIHEPYAGGGGSSTSFLGHSPWFEFFSSFILRAISPAILSIHACSRMRPEGFAPLRDVSRKGSGKFRFVEDGVAWKGIVDEPGWAFSEGYMDGSC